MISRPLRIVAMIATAIILASFGFFVVDQARESSNRQVRRLKAESPDPGERAERVRERRHGTARELIDDANDILLKPFAGIVDSGSIWVQRIVPGGLALLLYGLALTLLAGYLPKRF